MKRSDANHDGFTLIEVLIVLLILTSLVGVVGVNVMRHRSESQIKTARIQISQFVSALRLFKLEQGRYPSTEEGLDVLVDPARMSGRPQRFPEEGYLDGRQIPVDPWGSAYLYLAPGRSGEPFEIISYGQDREPGSEGVGADLSSSAP